MIVGADDSGEAVDAAVAALQARGATVELLPQGQWPEVARAVGEAVAGGRADFGVLACWTGTGTSIMANKVPGVRAALCWEPWIAEGARRWNDANVLVLSLKGTSAESAAAILDAWLGVTTPDAGELANIAEIARYEAGRDATDA
ncbi:MAG: RpiB/LacA/LacB family sugar-phosphate isomerase [Actinomycetota bacterium]